jgi:3'(2'), 5'-bisphosphate nucleotidase
VTHDALALAFARIALAAGAAILDVQRQSITTLHKSDGSPVTAADLAAEAVIHAALKRLLPKMPIISEEADEPLILANPDADFILVDPLDGTREFVAGRHEYTVNIALIRNCIPVAGVVYAPALHDLYLGGETAFHACCAPQDPISSIMLDPIQCRLSPEPPVLAISRSHLDLETKGFVDKQGQCQRIDIGSSLKFGLIARGHADLYPRFSPTMEWDTAAGHAVLNAAGGSLLTADGAPFLYGKTASGFRNGSFIARGRMAKGRVSGSIPATG